MTLLPYDLTTTLILTTKGDVDIVNAVGDEIREENWMGTDFAYPCIRIGISRFPEDAINGNCKGKWFSVSASAYIYTEGTSSKECQNLMGLIGKRFQNRVISNANMKSLALSINYMPIVPNGLNSWRGEVVITGRLYEI